MKNLKYVLILSLIFLITKQINAQNDTTNTIKFSQRIPADLVLDLKIKETYPIGYANCFTGKVVSVNRGILKDTVILITVKAGDDENYKILSSGDDNTVFKIHFMQNKNNEKYRTAYVTGFVDSGMTSWRIIAIEKN